MNERSVLVASLRVESTFSNDKLLGELQLLES